MTAIDGDLLDRLEAELRQADGPVTSAALADRLGIDDGEANPKTREALRDLQKEREVPLIGTHAGYRIITSRAELDDCLDTLDSRIAGIEERKQHVIQAFEDREQKTLAGGVQR